MKQSDALPDATQRLMSGEMWRGFCDRMAALGDIILAEKFATGPNDTAEGFRYLARFVSLSIQRATSHSDPAFPTFFRWLDDVFLWGGPNVDNCYIAARIDPKYSYRISGNVSRSHGFIMSQHRGWWGYPDFKIGTEKRAMEFTPGPDGQLDVYLGGPERATNWVPMDEEAQWLIVRDYVSDWESQERCGWSIHRLDTEPMHRGVYGPAEIEAALEDAARDLELVVKFWSDRDAYPGIAIKESNANNLPKPVSGGPGSALIYYSYGVWKLAPDEALIVELPAPGAEYWSVQLQNNRTEALDTANRLTSYTGHTAHVDTDGRARFVIAHEDPGVPNWLDSEGRHTGMPVCRWIRPAAEPEVATRVVKFADIRQHLPADHPVVDEAARREGLRRRRFAYNRWNRR